MRSEIKTLIDSWVKDNQEFIDDNYCSVEEWLLDQFDENPEAVSLDWFTIDEIENSNYDELRYLIADYLHKKLHGDVTAEEYLECWAD